MVSGNAPQFKFKNYGRKAIPPQAKHALDSPNMFLESHHNVKKSVT